MSNVKRIYHYTYLITHLPSTKLYIGVRSSKVPPEEDLGIRYLSSSLDKDFKLDQKANPDHYCYEVLGAFPTRDKAGEEEMRLHELHDVGRNPAFYNRCCASTYFRMIWTDDKKQKLRETIKKYYEDPVNKQKTSEAIKKYYEDPVNKQKTSEAITQWHAKNPITYETKQKMSKSRLKYFKVNPVTIETKQKMSESAFLVHEQLYKKMWAMTPLEAAHDIEFKSDGTPRSERGKKMRETQHKNARILINQNY